MQPNTIRTLVAVACATVMGAATAPLAFAAERSDTTGTENPQDRRGDATEGSDMTTGQGQSSKEGAAPQQGQAGEGARGTGGTTGQGQNGQPASPSQHDANRDRNMDNAEGGPTDTRRGELTEAADAQFRQLDEQNRGYLDFAAVKPMTGNDKKAFDKADRNRDGRLSMEEFREVFTEWRGKDMGDTKRPKPNTSTREVPHDGSDDGMSRTKPDQG